jgi:hypothetical protein
LAFYRHVLEWKSGLHAQHGARPLLALVALAQGYPLWVWSFVRDAELSAIARSLTRGHFPSVDQLDGIAGEVKHPRARPRHTAGMKLSRSEPVVRRRRVVGGYRFAS